MKKVHSKKMKILLGILVVLVLGVLFFGAKQIYLYCNTPKEYLVTTENRFDYQKHSECSGYASAYVLRSLGIEADGLALYDQIEPKMEKPAGNVNPFVLIKFLNDQGYKASFKIGSTIELKHEIAKGVPVIVVVRTVPNITNLHYLPIVGYDEENYYAAESLIDCTNVFRMNYNRRIRKTDFENMWDIPHIIKHIYITIRLK